MHPEYHQGMRLEVIPDDTLQQMIIPGPLQTAGSEADNKPRLTAKAKSTHKPKGSSWTYAKKPSIAAATIIASVTFFAIVFLLIWYFKRKRQQKARQRLNTENQLEDPFNVSSLVLNEDTSKSLDEFLLKDIEPERTSLMFSRSRSPSFTFVVDESYRRNPTRLYRGNYDASSMDFSKLDSLTRVTTDGRSMGLSELTPTTSSSSGAGAGPAPDFSSGSGSGSGSGSSSGSGSGSGSGSNYTQVPVQTSTSRLSRALTGAPTARSSTWTTTSASSKSSVGPDIIQQDSIHCQNFANVGAVVSRPHDVSTRNIPVRSMVCSNPSNASRASSRVSVSNLRYSAGRAEQPESSQTVYVESQRGSMSLESPADSSWSASGRASQLPSILSVSSTQSPGFGSSEG
ncbi:uncharacterized protein N7503_004924 [Penicillium pulvis]|uniref:uncharacterized protein n=1 Tax=Penicillium pulvis TaxID=1562058 RepID=UPI0025480C89|nr:uncharacterized protein N7503_004924 [Penicillium pulvis]KAJ5802474.1 hypothetical protein N7503_004924 [Penicillium pulvis]